MIRFWISILSVSSVVVDCQMYEVGNKMAPVLQLGEELVTPPPNLPTSSVPARSSGSSTSGSSGSKHGSREGSSTASKDTGGSGNAIGSGSLEESTETTSKERKASYFDKTTPLL